MDVSQLLTVQLPTLLVVIIGVPAVLAGYIVGFELLVRRLPDGVRPAVRPWIWVAPALLFVAFFLVYPAIDTLRYSLLDNHGAFIGLANYQAIFSDSSVLIAIRNNIYWLGLSTWLGLWFRLLLAVLSGPGPHEPPGEARFFMPMAVSATALAVIWGITCSDPPA